jgi:hypothetical protein
MIEFIDPSLQLHLVTISTTCTYTPYNAIADLHTFQFTVAHALGFLVSTNVSWQRISTHKLSFQITMKSSCHSFFDPLGMPAQFYNSNSPVFVLYGTKHNSTHHCDLPSPINDCLIPIYDSRDIDAARTLITENTWRMIAVWDNTAQQAC